MEHKTPLEHLNEYLKPEIQLVESSTVVEKARHVAVQAHADQTRWNGDAYITHPIRIAEAFKSGGFSSELQAVAYLHDVVEDTELNFDDLRRFGFSELIVQAVDSVTKRDGENYLNFVLRARENTIGRIVKLGDISDNLRDLDGKRNKSMRDKYELAVWILRN